MNKTILNDDKIKKKLILIFQSILKIKNFKNTSKINPEYMEDWDSLRHLNIIMAIEEEFKSKFTTDELINLLDFDSIFYILKNKIK